MKTFATILLLAAGIFVNTSAQNTNSLIVSYGSLETVLNLQDEVVNTSAQNTNPLRASPGSLEIVLNLKKRVYYGTNMDVVVYKNVFYYNEVAFSSTKDIAMEVTFHNVGEVTMSCADEFFGLTVVWDGKEYKGTHEPTFIFDGFSEFPPKTAWQFEFPLIHYDIPPEALSSGRHTIAVKDAGVESNILTIFIDPDK